MDEEFGWENKLEAASALQSHAGARLKDDVEGSSLLVWLYCFVVLAVRSKNHWLSRGLESKRSRYQQNIAMTVILEEGFDHNSFIADFDFQLSQDIRLRGISMLPCHTMPHSLGLQVPSEQVFGVGLEGPTTLSAFLGCHIQNQRLRRQAVSLP